MDCYFCQSAPATGLAIVDWEGDAESDNAVPSCAKCGDGRNYAYDMDVADGSFFSSTPNTPIHAAHVSKLLNKTFQRARTSGRGAKYSRGYRVYSMGPYRVHVTYHNIFDTLKLSYQLVLIRNNLESNGYTVYWHPGTYTLEVKHRWQAAS